MKNTAIVICFLLMMLNAHAQRDSVRTDSPVFKSLAEVIVNGFEQSRRLQYSTATVNVIRNEDADRYNKTSLVQGVNTVPGVRMEERSPGSYRINIRGSSLRSPFGVRNVKVYWNDIPITDPGGNTYFNQFAFNNFSSIEIYKGPAGSMYGAGTGGLILMQSLTGPIKPGFSVEYMTGSFGLHNVLASASTSNADNRNIVTYAHNEHDGYRQQSAMRRNNISWSSAFNVNGRQQLSANILFTDLYYQTPGGLTKAEFDKDPRASRPAAGGFPGAVQAKAAIYQKNFLAGVRHRYIIDSNWTNTTSLYVAHAQIRNPTVRNYERRSEPHVGGRSVFNWQKRSSGAVWKLSAGGELQHGFFNTKVYQNKQGNSDTLQTDDDIKYNTYSLFAQGDVNVNDKLFITAGTSLNNTKVQFTRLTSYPVKIQSRTYKQEWAPRVFVLYALSENSSVFATVARGFSPPSISELLPSNSVISTSLEAESGTNYEAGVRLSPFTRQVYIQLSGYYFRLNNTLVQRRDISGADYFINAGNTKQKGIDASVAYNTGLNAEGTSSVSLKAAYTYAHYRYGIFTRDTIDLSGKKLPSVPANTISLLADVEVKGLYANAGYYYASQIFLNDVNTASVSGYHLLGLRLGWKKSFKKIAVNIYAGADNLLDEVYSLGNDINDARGRYYNTAAGRNYYGGLSFQFAK